MLQINMSFVNVGPMLKLNSDMPTHCFNVGAMLQINMLFFNVGAMLKINTDTQTHCCNVGAMLQINMDSLVIDRPCPASTHERG